MRSWSSRSADRRSEPGELDTLRRRFVEASRRAEVIALVNAAGDEAELGRVLVEELSEAYDAEIAFLLAVEGDDAGWRVLSTVGLDPTAEAALPEAEWIDAAAASDAPAHGYEVSLDGDRPQTTMVGSFAGSDARRVLIGVARLGERPFDDAETALLAGISTSVGQALERVWGFEERERLIDQLESLFLGTVQALANALEAKDRDTADHALSMVDLAVEVGRRLELSASQLDDLRYAAIFHDIGKIATPDAILNKPGPLDDGELALIRQHTIFGEQILAPVPRLSDVRRIVRHDHERWDGNGYPDGLREDEIPLASRIVFVVDAYNAMVSDRPYRGAMSGEQAVHELRMNAGSQFDPSIVEAFVAALDHRQSR